MREIKRLPGITGCSDHDCIFGHEGGMGTNGGCACVKDIRSMDMRQRIMYNTLHYRKLIAELQAQIDDLSKETPPNP